MLSFARRCAPSTGADTVVAVALPWPPSRPPDVLQPQMSATNAMVASLAIDDRQHALVRCPSEWEAHLEVRAVFSLGDQHDGAAVRLNALCDDGQTDPGAAHRPTLRVAPLVERFED